MGEGAPKIILTTQGKDLTAELTYAEQAELEAAEKLLDWCEENALEPEILINKRSGLPEDFHF